MGLHVISAIVIFLPWLDLALCDVAGDTVRPWPDLSCYPLYQSNFITEAYRWCRENLENGNVFKYNQCHTSKCCMLHMMGILYPYRHSRYFLEVIWMDVRGKHSLSDLIRGEISSKPGTPKETDHAIKLADSLVHKVYTCWRTFKRVYRRWKQSDVNWTQLYDCVERHFGCPKQSWQ